MNEMQRRPSCLPAAAIVGHDAADAELAALARALAHPLRVRIVRTLARRRACLCGELVAGLPRAQSTVSQHLKVLRDAGLVVAVGQGQRVCYALDHRALARLGRAVARLSAPARARRRAAPDGCRP